MVEHIILQFYNILEQYTNQRTCIIQQNFQFYPTMTGSYFNLFVN